MSQEKISIIINNIQDSIYLPRLLSNIFSQTFKNIELLLVVGDTDSKNYDSSIKLINGDEQYWVKNAVSSAIGDYIIFLSPTSIINRRFFEKSMLNKQDDIDYIITDIYIPGDIAYTRYRWNRFSLYGKIFLSNKIKDIVNSYSGDITIPELSMACLNLYSSFSTSDNVIYESNPIILEKEPIRRNEKDNIAVWLLQLEELSIDDRIGYLNKWLSDQNINNINLFEKIEMIMDIDFFSSDKNLAFYLAKNWVSKIYVTFTEDKNNIAYNCVKNFFLQLNLNREQKAIIINTVGLSMKQYDYLMKYDLSDYLFIFDKELPEDYISE